MLAASQFYITFQVANILLDHLVQGFSAHWNQELSPVHHFSVYLIYISVWLLSVLASSSAAAKVKKSNATTFKRFT